MATDNSTVEAAIQKGNSSSEKLFDLIIIIIINYIFTWEFTISHRRERKCHGPLRAQIKQG